MEKIIATAESLFQNYGYLAVGIGSFIEITPLGWLVPGAIILAIAGFFANGSTHISLGLVLLIGSVSAWLPLLIAYALGHISGMWLVNKLHQEHNAIFAKRLLVKHGGTILITAMMVNLTRFWVAYIAGVTKYQFKKFFVFSAIASLSWVSIMTLLGFFAGYERGNIEKLVGATGIVGWLLFAIASFLISKSIKHGYHRIHQKK